MTTTNHKASVCAVAIETYLIKQFKCTQLLNFDFSSYSEKLLLNDLVCASDKNKPSCVF